MIGPYKIILKYDDAGVDKVAALLRGADAAFANLEGSIFDLASFKGAPAAVNGGGTPLSEAAVATDLKTMGIDLVSHANNHATDYGVEGMLETRKVLDGAGIVHAGSGLSLPAARRSAYFKTPKGMVALIAAASTFTDMSVAGATGKKTNARPGLSPLRARPITLVTEAEMVGLRLIAARQGGLPGVPLDPNARELTIGGQAFRVADEPGLTYDLNVGDREAVVQSVREADKAADLVVFSIHAHETASGYSEDPKPADFLPPLFHKLVDAGADIIVRHGPHALQGVEIYKGKPIFYGLASLFFQVGDKTRRFGRGASSWRMPDEWYDSAVAVSEFRDGKVSVIRIYPLIISFEDDRMPGTPRIASPKDARRILGQVKRASAQFGTVVSIENNVGVIRVSSAR